jgi:murein DD-endopeptidase MepM/ murein hydrolase activator NlpD
MVLVQNKSVPMKLLLTMIFAVMMTLAGCATAPETYTTTAPTAEITTRSTGRVFWHPARPGLFAWPVRGPITSYFGTIAGKVKNKGIDIKSSEGSGVRAAKAGKVVFCDTQLKGFGQTIILDHGNNFQTVYSYNSAILVHVGEVVEQNMVIAKVGRSGRATEPSLHFEIRKNGVPQNPVYYLKQ